MALAALDVAPESMLAQAVSALLSRLHLPASTAWSTVALGPIGRRLTPLVVTASAAASIAEGPKMGGGGARFCDNERLVQTAPELAPFVGYSLTLVGTQSKPPVQARYHPRFRLWVLEARAWRSAAGPYVVWSSALDVPCDLTFHFRGEEPTAQAVAELGRCADLIFGRGARIGRPTRWADPSWRSLAEEAEARKSARPGLTWAIIADLLGVHQRTLRLYRQELRRDKTARKQATCGPALVAGSHGP